MRKQVALRNLLGFCGFQTEMFPQGTATMADSLLGFGRPGLPESAIRVCETEDVAAVLSAEHVDVF